MSKKCKEDQILNPETNRCVKKSGAIGKKILAELKTKADKKKCKEDEILNPETNRCVKKSGAIGKKILDELKTKANKKCKNDEILNPETNRCVKKTGNIGKKILKKNKSKKRTSKSRRKTKKSEDDCEDEKIFNPKTNRCVSIYSKIGMKLLDEAVKKVLEYEKNNPKIYYPPNKVLYKDKIATIKCRYYGRPDIMNTYGIVFDDTGKEKEFVHHDDLTFLSHN